jgi:hypothetical protein
MRAQNETGGTSMEDLKDQLLSAIRLTGTDPRDDQIIMVDRGIPHKPRTLPSGKMGVYSFVYQGQFLKIGKAGPNSHARFHSQHYHPTNSRSNLANSILNDPEMREFNLTPETIGDWIKKNTRRIDVLLDASLGMFVLNFVEAFLHLACKPKYEGYENQRNVQRE